MIDARAVHAEACLALTSGHLPPSFALSLRYEFEEDAAVRSVRSVLV